MRTYKVVLLRRTSQFSEWYEFKTVEIKAKTIGSAISKAEQKYNNPYCKVSRVYYNEI